jgi:hypothetical protein
MAHIYVAGPYSTGDTMLHIRAAIKAADALMVAGFVPYVPHLTGFWHVISPKPYEDWMELDMAWLRRCDAVLRLPGESSGADREVALAAGLDMPVYTDLGELIGEVNR